MEIVDVILPLIDGHLLRLIFHHQVNDRSLECIDHLLLGISLCLEHHDLVLESIDLALLHSVHIL